MSGMSLDWINAPFYLFIFLTQDIFLTKLRHFTLLVEVSYFISKDTFDSPYLLFVKLFVLLAKSSNTRNNVMKVPGLSRDPTPLSFHVIFV